MSFLACAKVKIILHLVEILLHAQMEMFQHEKLKQFEELKEIEIVSF